MDNNDLYDKAHEKLNNVETKIYEKDELLGFKLGHKYNQTTLKKLKEIADKAAKEADNSYERRKIFGINIQGEEQQKKHQDYHKRAADVEEKIISRENNIIDNLKENLIPIVKIFLPSSKDD